MKFVTFGYQGNTGVGLVDGAGVLPLQDFDAEAGASMIALMNTWDDVREKLAIWAAGTHPHLALKDVHLCAPVPRPGKILAMGLNYRDHVEEAHLGTPEEQIWFCKQPTSATGPNDPIYIPPVSDEVDYEAEMVAIIGRGGRYISKEDAPKAVFGFCCGNDVSCRDWQSKSSQWMLGKSFDHHAPFGPWVTTTDEVGDPHTLQITCHVNGEERQNSNTSFMIYNVWDQIACISQVMTLEPGDVIFTGTPGGVGLGRRPRAFLKDGDIVHIEIEKLGSIESVCAPEPDRRAAV